MRQFYREDAPEEIEDEILADWMDVLEALPAGAIRKGWIDYQRNGPRSKVGKLIRPTAGDIYQRAVRFLPPPPPRPALPPPPPRTRITPEARDRLLRANGYDSIADALLGASKRPSAQWVDE